MKTRSWISWFQLIGVLLFVFILVRIDFSKVIAQLTSFRLWWLAAYTLCFLLALVAKAMRWRSALSAQGVEVRVVDATRIYFVSSFLGAVTPGRVGEISKITYL